MATDSTCITVAFDVGGVLSKYPDIFRPIILALHASPGIRVMVVSDMHPREKIIDMLVRNGFGWVQADGIVSADYQTHGESCKAVACREHGVDVLVDDFIGYVAEPGAPPVRLLVMPDASRDYYHPDWQTDRSEGNFGRRRNPPESKKPPK